jgi:diguanylate cyclase (GGDEF)-like protein
MPDFNLAIAATFVAQTVGASVMALLLFGFYRQYRKSYLLHWTLGWSALAVYHLATGSSMAAAVRFAYAAAHPGRIAGAVVAGVAGYLQIAWFLFGAYELVRRRPVRIFDAQRMIAGAVMAGLATSLVFLSDDGPAALRYFSRVGIRASLAAFAFSFAAYALWRARANRQGVGFTVLGAAFAVYAIEQLQYVGITAFTLAGRVLPYSSYLTYVDFLLQSVIGIGMISCLLEDEREAAELAGVQIEHLAYHDAMTGLPNRPLFIDRLIVGLAQASRGGQKLAVFFLDLDRFKDINDSLGHSVGDALLKSVADRVRRCVREGDTVARFGGDEFTLMIPRIEAVEDAAKIAQKIIETLKIPFLINERELFVTTSIGISIYPSDGLDPETLVRNADTAMYRAKDQGRDNYQLYAPAMNARALERLALENMLRKALHNDELVLHYQPVIDPTAQALVSVEALLRWRHPQLGLLSPAHFISVAEISGLIVPIGEWVLKTACKQLRAWQKKTHPDLLMSVNLSARQFQAPDLLAQVRVAIENSGIAPGTLQLEITESNAMQNADNTIYTLRELKELGVKIAMDDFGTGYSSLNYLKRFPIDTLKLDQSFVRDICSDASDAAIVSAVITLSHSLNLTVVAEGVETAEQLAFLVQERCDLIQGFYFSHPRSVEDMEPFLREGRAPQASHRPSKVRAVTS